MKKPRGFAAMSQSAARKIQSQGGQNSPMRFKKNDKRTSDSGRKGGTISRKPKAVA